MAYTSKLKLNSLDGSEDFKNSSGNHECVVLVQEASNAPSTFSWKKGKKVLDCSTTEITAGTIIATFDDLGNYPSFNRHAAIYESHDQSGIKVIDQWNNQGKAKRRKIHRKNSTVRDVNDANWYFIVE